VQRLKCVTHDRRGLDPKAGDDIEWLSPLTRSNLKLRKYSSKAFVDGVWAFYLNILLQTYYSTYTMHPPTTQEPLVKVTLASLYLGERMCFLGDIPLAHKPRVSGSNLFLIPSPLFMLKLSLRVYLSLIPVFNPILHQLQIC
jgi:hypothetical protein